MGHAKIDKIDNKQRDGSNRRQKEFVAPADIKEIIGDAQDKHALQTEQSG